MERQPLSPEYEALWRRLWEEWQDNDEDDVILSPEKLEELDRKRRRALDANFLIQCWTEVHDRGSLTTLEEIQRQGGAENKVRCAVIARQLMRISQRLDPASWSQSNGNGARTNGITNGVTGTSRKQRRAEGGGRIRGEREGGVNTGQNQKAVYIAAGLMAGTFNVQAQRAVQR